MSGLPTGAGSGPGPLFTRAVLHGGFVVAGTVTTLLGPLLPMLIARWSLRDADAGLFFALQFSGNLAGLAALSALLARWGYRGTVSAGFGLMAAGVAGLMASGQWEARISTLVFGCGLGLTLSGVNLWIGEDAGAESPRRRAAALSLLNMTWGIGAIAFPPLLVAAQHENLVLPLLLGIAALCGIAALVLRMSGTEPRSTLPDEGKFAEPQRPLHWPGLILLACLFFLYVGTEASVAGWTASLAQRFGSVPSGAGWALTPMFFWAGLLLGRGLAPVILRAVSESAVLLGGLGLAAGGTAALLGTRTFSEAAACVAAAGLGMAAVYPLLVAWMLGMLGARVRRRASVLFALGCAGGATLPWLVGVASTQAGSLRAGLVVPLAGCLLMTGLILLARRPSALE